MPTMPWRDAVSSVPLWAVLTLSVLVGASGLAAAERASVAAMSGAAILQQLRSFATLGSVLYVAAHPDDENTQAITYLARGRGYRTAYLSLTRGDGGQNLLGPQLREQLGVARTQELLAARRLDGGRQYFTRARDFGYSKRVQETLDIWDRQAVLGDIVRVIRSFRPDVVITRFSPHPAETHGHHTASAVLALEAFSAAGDPHAFVEQLGTLAPWQPTRILHNVGMLGAAAPPTADAASIVTLDVGGVDPVLGETFAEIAKRSRAMHKTQGFGIEGMGPPPNRTTTERFLLLAGAPATHDIMDGSDTTWARVPGGAEIARLTDAAIAEFKPDAPAASVPALLAIRRRLAAIPTDPVIADKRAQLDRVLQACLGLEVETVVDRAEVVPGETMKLRHTAVMRAGPTVRWTAVRYPSVHRALTRTLALRPGQPAVRDATQVLPSTTPTSQPYWLRHEGTVGLFQVDDPALIGLAENPPAFPIEYVFDVEGQTLVVAGEPVHPVADATTASPSRRLDVIPPVSLHFPPNVRLFAPGATRPVTVELTAARPGVVGSLQLDAPAGWTIAPTAQPFRLPAAGDHQRFTFRVTAPAPLTTAVLGASVEVNGRRFDQQRVALHYEHIPFQLLQPAARLKAVVVDLAIRGHRVGYVPGAGDDVGAALEEMGYAVTSLTGADLTAERLRGLDAVVLGVRAFNTRTDLAGALPALFAFVDGGGTLLVQYNTVDRLPDTFLAPLQLHVSRNRVTDENAAVTFLAPEHPVLAAPNRITAADFDGWVQERGLYFPDRWDATFTPILAFADPGEPPLTSGLLVARHGKGFVVYTSLAWFRQLPEGVPGAYRLFANLVSLGK